MPSTTFYSTGVAASLQGDPSSPGGVSANEFYIVSNDGYPAVYRGFYISTNTDYVSLQNIVLNKDFAVHAWIKVDVMATGGESNTVFSKDKYDVASYDSSDFIRCAISDTENLTVEMVRDGAQNFRKFVLDTTIISSSWNYVVYSFAFSADATSDPKSNSVTVVGWINTSSSTPVTYDRFFINDKSDYTAYVGNTRDSATTFDHPL